MVSLDTLRRTLYRHSLGPLYDYLEQIESLGAGFAGIYVNSLTELGTSAAAVSSGGGTDQTIEFEIINDSGDRLTWFSGPVTVTLTDTTAGNGTAYLMPGATKTLEAQVVDGVGSVVVRYYDTWAADDTMRLEFSSDTPIMGATLDDGFTNTLVA